MSHLEVKTAERNQTCEIFTSSAGGALIQNCLTTIYTKMTVYSTLRRTKDEYQAMERAKANLGFKPPVDFWKPATAEEDDGDDVKCNKDAYTSIRIPMTLDGHTQRLKSKYE